MAVTNGEVAPIIDALERAPSIVLPLVREMPPAMLTRRPAPRRWSAHEHACHYSHYSVLIMFRHLALHDFFHAYRIEELVLKKEW